MAGVHIFLADRDIQRYNLPTAATNHSLQQNCNDLPFASANHYSRMTYPAQNLSAGCVRQKMIGSGNSESAVQCRQIKQGKVYPV